MSRRSRRQSAKRAGEPEQSEVEPRKKKIPPESEISNARPFAADERYSNDGVCTVLHSGQVACLTFFSSASLERRSRDDGETRERHQRKQEEEDRRRGGDCIRF